MADPAARRRRAVNSARFVPRGRGRPIRAGGDACAVCADLINVYGTRASRTTRGAVPARSGGAVAGMPLAPPAAVIDALAPRRVRFERFAAMTEPPVAVLALLIAPALVVESHAKTALVRDLAHGVNWIIWLAFCGEYAV